jgi:hypothetical protein
MVTGSTLRSRPHHHQTKSDVRPLTHSRGLQLWAIAHCRGFRPEIGSYSAFYENDRPTPTGLAGYLRERGMRRIFLAGLATDFCVYYSAIDAGRLGLDVMLLEAALQGDQFGGIARYCPRRDDSRRRAARRRSGLDHAVREVRFGIPPRAMISALNCSIVVR